MIQTKAATLAKSTQYISQYPDINKFKWSTKQLEGFLRRYNFSNRCKTTIAQKLPEELEAQ